VIDTGTDFADLGDASVDVAVRILSMGREPDGALAGRKAVSGSNAVYGDPETGRWIGVSSTPPRTGWTATHEFEDFPIGAVIPTGVVRRDACSHGMGIAMLPCMLGDPGLHRLTEPNPAFDVWVLVHPDLRRNPRLRLFRDTMVDALASMEPAMQGRR
jgi:DNA-binding transcriptional LysR family regulator